VTRSREEKYLEEYTIIKKKRKRERERETGERVSHTSTPLQVMFILEHLFEIRRIAL
jgi:hypothetical protein